MAPMGLSLNIIYFPLYFMVFLEASPDSVLPHLSCGYPCIIFVYCSYPQILRRQFYKENFLSEVMSMSRIIPETVAFTFSFTCCAYSTMSSTGLSLNQISFALSFMVFFEASPVSALPHLPCGYLYIHVCLLLLPSKPQTTVSHIAITFS